MNQVEVKSGLEIGQLIVKKGAQKLSQGSEVVY